MSEPPRHLAASAPAASPSPLPSAHSPAPPSRKFQAGRDATSFVFFLPLFLFFLGEGQPGEGWLKGKAT